MEKNGVPEIEIRKKRKPKSEEEVPFQDDGFASSIQYNIDWSPKTST